MKTTPLPCRTCLHFYCCRLPLPIEAEKCFWNEPKQQHQMLLALEEPEPRKWNEEEDEPIQ